MPAKRMDRTQFFEAMSPLGEDALRKALWNLYWRSSAQVRERIESELDPAEAAAKRKAAVAEAVDPGWTRHEVETFVELARSGAYMGGDRRVSRQERSRWRLSYRRLVKEARAAIVAGDLDDEEFDDAAAAIESLIDLACEVKGYDYFHSEDPVEAAQLVVSDEAALLWSRVLERQGFAAFARHAAPQLVRWEFRYGWTRTGWGRTSEKETSLAAVLAGMLSAPDAWVSFADAYLAALDDTAAVPGAPVRRDRHESAKRGKSREERAGDLAAWHRMLLDRLIGGDGEDRLDRLAQHPSLAGPQMAFFRGLLADARGDTASARTFAHEALVGYPGDREFQEFAKRIGAPQPARPDRSAGPPITVYVTRRR